MDKINIALLCNGYGRVMRGAEQFTYQFYNQMKDVLDIDIYGIGKTDHSIKIKSKFRDNFRLPWRNGRAYLESYYFGKTWYKRMINSKKYYDLIINNAGLGGSYWCNKYRKKTGTPFITRARGGGREERINYFFKPNSMVFLTKENEEYTKRFLPKIRTVVIPNAINLEEYNKKKKSSPLTEGLEQPIYLGTSAFVSYKRNDLIIRAVSQLDHGSLLLLGGGPLKERTLSLGKKLLGHRFRYGGVIPYSNREKIINLYRNADVFVQAARKEAFGVVFLEAMASNLPVVTQNDKRRKEIINDAGILVNCEDTDYFASSLLQASGRDWGDIPLNQASKYDWKIIKQSYQELLETVANETKGEGPFYK
jgi:glycosyltransferase involved in cell wall biosynthesis